MTTTTSNWKMGGSNAQANSDAARHARQKLEEQIHRGIPSAEATIAHVVENVPQDAIVSPTDAWHFKPADDGAPIAMEYNGDTFGFHGHAFQQAASKVKVPAKYAKELASAKEEWRHQLAAHIFNEHYHHDTRRHLMRRVGPQVRGWLSDRYMRLNTFDLIEEFVEGCKAIGAVPVEGIATDIRVRLRALMPVIYEPVESEVLAYGLEFGNCDFGGERYTLRAFINRCFCTNKMMMDDGIAKVHVGGRLSDDIRYSERTYQLDTDTMKSASRDVIRGLLAPEKIEAYNLGIAAAHDKELSWGDAMKELKALNKAETEKVKIAFESNDDYNMPGGSSRWRLANAISWIAQAKDVSDERRIDLEQLAGTVTKVAA